MIDFEGKGHEFIGLPNGLCQKMVCTKFDDEPIEVEKKDGTKVVVTDDRGTYVRCLQLRGDHD